MTVRRTTRRPAARRRMIFPTLPDLASELANRVRQIPSGSVTTFGDLARSLGDRHAAVWVARWLAMQAEDSELAWHRVVRSTGELSGDGERQLKQARRLQAEGQSLLRLDSLALRVALDRRLADFKGRPPLDRLGRWLSRAAGHVRETPVKRRPSIVAGVDVAYPSPEVATLAAVALEFPGGSVLGSVRACLPVAFPYIPGYLTFRELPALMEGLRLLEDAGWRPEVVFVDGQGRMHPRRAGVATGFAAVTGISTIGVGKSLLHGRVGKPASTDGLSPVLDADELLGYAIGSPRSRKPIYVSVGGWISLDQAVDWTRRMMTGGRLPRPIAEADRLSKRGGT